jgi:hypothetical protein
MCETGFYFYFTHLSISLKTHVHSLGRSTCSEVPSKGHALSPPVGQTLGSGEPPGGEQSDRTPLHGFFDAKQAQTYKIKATLF